MYNSIVQFDLIFGYFLSATTNRKRAISSLVISFVHSIIVSDTLISIVFLRFVCFLSIKLDTKAFVSV